MVARKRGGCTGAESEEGELTVFDFDCLIMILARGVGLDCIASTLGLSY